MGGLKLKVTPTAKKDIQESIMYYNGKQKGLGKKFEYNVNIALKQIQRMPQSTSFIFDNVRYKVVEKFPYIIVYDFNEDNINILRIFNTYRNSKTL